VDQPDPLRALIVTNMYPTPERPAFGRFVRDQVEALRALPELEVELFTFGGSGGAASYLDAARGLRRAYRGRRFDVVHAHFGLTAWPALGVRGAVHGVTLHGTDLADLRSRPLTLAALPLLDLVGVVSEDLAGRLPRWATARSRPAVLPCGVDLGRFRPIARAEARGALGLDPAQPCLLFPADPARPEKRHDLAAALATHAGNVPLLSLGDVEPERVPLYVNAANAVLVTSDREGFGLGVLEAMACDVPVLATPHGVAAEALAGVAGTRCEPFSTARWGDALAPLLAAADPRVQGRARAERYSAGAMALRVAEAWRERLERRGRAGG
jgi:teichuronic acid biosynthesis glycosyltransferase TuaC